MVGMWINGISRMRKLQIAQRYHCLFIHSNSLCVSFPTYILNLYLMYRNFKGVWVTFQQYLVRETSPKAPFSSTTEQLLWEAGGLVLPVPNMRSLYGL